MKKLFLSFSMLSLMAASAFAFETGNNKKNCCKSTTVQAECCDADKKCCTDDKCNMCGKKDCSAMLECKTEKKECCAKAEK